MAGVRCYQPSVSSVELAAERVRSCFSPCCTASCVGVALSFVVIRARISYCLVAIAVSKLFLQQPSYCIFRDLSSLYRSFVPTELVSLQGEEIGTDTGLLLVDGWKNNTTPLPEQSPGRRCIDQFDSLLNFAEEVTKK